MRGMPAHFFCWVTSRPKLTGSMDRRFVRRNWRLHGVWGPLVGALIVAGSSGALVAQQSLSAAGVRDLSFGVVIGGTASWVPRWDRVRSGQLEITGARRAEVAIQFVLPQDLRSPSGALMPLLFQPGDGGYSNRPRPRGRAFDPRNPLLARLSNRGWLYITLGGTTQPSVSQAPGVYRGTVSLTLSYTGT